jgi:3-deoxy-D-manno-octulosonic acid kinase
MRALLPTTLGMDVPAGFVEVRSRREVAWVRSDLAALGLDALWREPDPLPGSKGRGGIGTLELQPGIVAVARPFRRGGALRSILGDRYADADRALAELAALERLRKEGVPVVAPLAALARKRRAFWRLRLLTERLDGALPLPAFCGADPQARGWAVESAAVTVRLAFEAGLVHRDLHPDNVLVTRNGDKVRAALVDLDRATFEKPLPQKSKDEMLVRMARYLARHPDVGSAFTRQDRLRFLRGLGFDAEARRAEVDRLWPLLARALRVRGLKAR